MERGIQKIFSTVPDTYELVNHVLTLGLDIVWRRKAVALAGKAGSGNWLDVCSGTGETAVYLSRIADENTRVFAADFCSPMLEKGILKKDSGRIIFTIADAGDLPFGDSSLDLVTISFATRNLNVNRQNLIRCFTEFHRVLRPGGRFLNLETSQPTSPLFRKVYHSYIGAIVRPVGRMLSGSDSGYAYLSSTIPRFYAAEELSEHIRTAGFEKVSFHNLMGGAAAIHEAVK